MDIPELQIEQPRTQKKKVSQKVLEKAEQYLDANGLSYEQLSPAQQTSVVKYIKKKKGYLWALIISTLSFILVSVICFQFIRFITVDYDGTFVPETYVIEIEDGSEVLKEIDEELKEAIILYGNTRSLLTSTVVISFYSSISGLVAAAAGLFFLRNDREVLDSFLPSVRIALETSGGDEVTWGQE